VNPRTDVICTTSFKNWNITRVTVICKPCIFFVIGLISTVSWVFILRTEVVAREDHCQWHMLGRTTNSTQCLISAFHAEIFCDKV
jgi:hypothetical protein